jgi:uncharacterized protein (DUF1697 family)
VQTYIQSGNAVFASGLPQAELELMIADGIAARFGFRPALALIGAEGLAAAIRDNPYPEITEGKALHIYFLLGPPDTARLQGLEAHARHGEAFAIRGDALYLRAPEGIGRSVLAEKLARALKDRFTARNLNTVLELARMAGVHTGM